MSNSQSWGPTLIKLGSAFLDPAFSVPYYPVLHFPISQSRSDGRLHHFQRHVDVILARLPLAPQLQFHNSYTGRL